MSHRLRSARVLARRPLTPRVNELVLEIPGDPPFRWHAGQHLAIHPAGGVPTHEGPLWYSIASAWDGREPPVLSLAIGPGTGAEVLGGVGPGAELSLAGPYGTFALPAAPGALLLAAGTGVAPLHAFVEETLAGGDDFPILLVVGARTEQDLLWHGELTALATRFARFAYEPVLSQPSAGWSGRRGYVQEHVRELAPKLPPGFIVRACGSVTMVESSLRALAELDVGPERVVAESY
jgi:CDP-4-dehydro-6-deoxyglucose reductase